MSRTIHAQYADPLDTLWLKFAEDVGIRVQRTPDTYASWDGAGTLSLSDSTGLDPDDCLAQMIFHEVCHALVQGPESLEWIDWGLENEGSGQDDVLEHACLRLQAALLTPLGLRDVLGPTTDFRSYYDALPPDPFSEQNPEERESIVRARAAFARRRQAPWGHHLEQTLERTARLIHTVAEAFTEPATGSLPLLYQRTHPMAPRHRLGFPLHPAPPEGARCQDCAWARPSASGKTQRCEQTGGRPIHPTDTVCDRYEPPFTCSSCGACCREAYDVVIVGPRDPALRAHPELFTRHTQGADLRREEGRCLALEGGRALRIIEPAIRPAVPPPPPAERRVLPRYQPDEESPFSCRIYEHRPRTCRDFTRGSAHCLEARQKVGLSR